MTYLMHRYPAELIDIVHAPSGARVLIRPVLPQDAELMQGFFSSLSPQSRRNRFFRTLAELPASLLNEFTSIDYHVHLALVASVLIEGEEVAIGEGRYVVSGDSAEFAIAVADGWQGQGIGRLLVERLQCRAAAEGVTRFFGEVLPTNAPMLRFAAKAGFALAANVDGLLVVEKFLEPKRDRSPCIEAAPYAPVLSA